MFAVIFTAKIKDLDAEYIEAASRMRDLAFEKYGCTAFTACSEGDTEVAISYWPTEDHIIAWKQDPEHLAAQKKGKAYWYAAYRIEVVEIKRAYEYCPNGQLT